MPQITEYNAPQGLGLQPTEVGIEATAAAGRRLSAFVSETAQAKKETGVRLASAVEVAGDAVVEWQARREISQGAAALAGLNNAKAKQWEESNKNADPNNPTVAQNFQSGLEADLQKFKSGFITQKGQDWAEAHIETIRNHYMKRAESDRATAAGQAMKVNNARTVDGNANAAYWAGSQEAVDLGIKNIRSSGMPAPAIEEGVAEVINRGVRGAIQRTGQIPDWVKSPEYSKYIGGDVMDKWEAHAERRKNANRADENAAEADQNRQQDAAVRKATSDTMTNFVTTDEHGNIDFKPGFFDQALKISQMPRGHPTLFNWGQTEQRREDSASDPATVVNLHDGLFKTENPTTELQLMEARLQKKISREDFATLHGMLKSLEQSPLKGPLYDTAMDAAKERLGVSVMPDGHERYSKFIQAFVPALQRMKAENPASPQVLNALNTKDPNSLISLALKTYEPDANEKFMAFELKRLGGALPPTAGGQPQPRGAVSPLPEREDQLEVGKTYQTARGPLKWTGPKTQFVKP